MACDPAVERAVDSRGVSLFQHEAAELEELAHVRSIPTHDTDFASVIVGETESFEIDREANHQAVGLKREIVRFAGIQDVHVTTVVEAVAPEGAALPPTALELGADLEP